MTKRVIHVGVGSFGRRWCSEFLTRNIADGTIEVVAIADVDAEAVALGQKTLGLPDSACHTSIEEAFATHEADFCTIVVPPEFHEAVVDVAIAHGVDILCEKPIAATMEASVRIARKVREAGRKMAVTMSHRFDQDKTTLRQVIRSGKLGKVSQVSCRYFSDMRGHMEWGALFRHTMQDPLLIEGAVHHLDLVADFAGAKCKTLFATTWKPDWAEYAGDTDGIVTMVFENGVRGVYEGSSSSATGLNDWTMEYVRVECENGTAILNNREIEVFTRQDIFHQRYREGMGQKLPLLQQPKWLNTWLIEKFCNWLDGGPEMETIVEKNVQASALIFASIESVRTNSAIEVQDYVGSFS
ncbi:Gfo/Idh/MocA family protein [Pelagovum pacificum]|uniref:Gfo/Idh/MocA family oxidoreductase n=1 Tax=Pelagovum pacificum TaxID=2588711 RepID=A0A5C5GIV9_9RHOB|nr:Gfo/Idh/MocA family oxidoreductase [Pelagovum pacificum]QQA42695.1 Gfo/Idh/MocA family oxidoreductase [Pelagovum pacificum]TNY34154.1 Gfo/Idh/MocA family oxidoreductase [Pelagovum pacificum]